MNGETCQTIYPIIFLKYFDKWGIANGLLVAKSLLICKRLYLNNLKGYFTHIHQAVLAPGRNGETLSCRDVSLQPIESKLASTADHYSMYVVLAICHKFAPLTRQYVHTADLAVHVFRNDRDRSPGLVFGPVTVGAEVPR